MPKTCVVLSIVGARPQFIKAAPVSRALRGIAREVLIHTGQHYDAKMSDVFFEELNIPAPDFNLGVGSGAHGWQTGQMLIRIEDVLLREQPDWVLVYGDTNSTLAGALAAVKLHIRIAHVEAGLRSFNRRMPEEWNRVLTDHTADMLFCPTQTAVDNLRLEGIVSGVHLVGDVMCDALRYSASLAANRSDVLAQLRVSPHDYVLATVHRPRNTDDLGRLQAILEALEEIGKNRTVVLPAHPRTDKALSGMGYRPGPGLLIVPPVGYLDMLLLEQHAWMILTDSGGVQKEAYLFGVPCVTLREETEWMETVEAGWNTLVGANRDEIVRASREFRPLGAPPPLFGDGHASERIAALLAARGS